MPKNIKPVMGHTLESVLGPIIEDPSRVIDPDFFRDEKKIQERVEWMRGISQEVLNRSNVGQCITEKQKEALIHQIENLHGVELNSYNTDKDITLHSANDVFHDTVHPGVMGLNLAAVIIEVKSSILDCVNCLNAECKQRDPLVPVEQVRARKALMSE